MIKIDTHEPTDIVRYLDAAYDVEVWDAISAGLGDYVWTGEVLSYIPGHEGGYTLERKTWDDIVGGTDEVEAQLRKVVARNPKHKHRLILEGVMEPSPTGVIIYKRKGNTNVFLGAQRGVQPQLAKKLNSWLADLYDIVEVHYTASTAASIQEIGHLYMHDQKPEEDRTIFRRYMKSVTWNPNPQVEKLMGLASNDTGIGETRAIAIIKKFGTVWNVAKASPQELAQVPGVGLKTATEFLQKIGRGDV